MCTFEEMVRKEGYKEGYKKGYKEGYNEGHREVQLTVYANMQNAAYDDNTICNILGVSMWKLRQLRKLSKNAVLQPKTV